MKFLIAFQLFFFSLAFANDEVQLLDDEIFYQKGVELYDKGECEKSFIIFFNLAQKGNKDATFNMSNMFFEGIGTTQDYVESLKYSWLCSLNGNKKCLKKIDKIKDRLDEKIFLSVAENITKILENSFEENLNSVDAFKLGYWYEKISPEIDLEKSYLWYSVSVSGGVYKAMKLRDRVGKQLEKEKLYQIQQEANKIFTKEKYFNQKEKKNDF